MTARDWAEERAHGIAAVYANDDEGVHLCTDEIATALREAERRGRNTGLVEAEGVCRRKAAVYRAERLSVFGYCADAAVHLADAIRSLITDDTTGEG